MMLMIGKNTSALGDQRGGETPKEGVVEKAVLEFGFEREQDLDRQR